jgi:FkbM family methyltransferase
MTSPPADGERIDVCHVPFTFRGRSGELQLERCGGRDQVVRQIEAAGWRSYEAPLPIALCELVARQPSAFLDVGANSGFYSLIAALCGCREIRAFEPVPFISGLLARNIEHTLGPGVQPIRVFHEAISDHNGTAELYMPDQGHGLIETSASLNRAFREQHSDQFQVKVSSLDQHFQNNPLQKSLQLVLKIDVESCEEQVLRGAEATITERRPSILVEILPGASLDFYNDFLARHGYVHYPLLHYINRLVATASIEPSVHQRDHLLIPKERIPPALLDSARARMYGQLIWLGKQLTSR